ncbi:MAG: winged helix-turn-helix domain-containing protein [Oscillospiraceae bacterium]|nr:winged helix-turn-helix domain-containing protein [Oscillospiraceae bacterium]
MVPVYIHYLRKKIDYGFSFKILRTVRKQGYMLTGS